jgi:membrane-bound metal-dependent hydrolase YbcI (DUF457 family)
VKGISHFISGVAAASFFPWTVEAALAGNPAYFILGAAFGLLPDTLDFKFYRFFYRYDRTITPDPRHPDPQAMAEQIAEAVEAAVAGSGMLRLKINTLRLATDQWRQFKIRFDPQLQGVEVELGPVVTTGQVPVPGPFPAAVSKGWKTLAVPIVETYEAVTTVDIFDGPAFGFEKDGEGKVAIHFLPWHRSWTHSLVVAAGLGLAALAVAGGRAGAVVFGAYAIHVLEDQLGFMGANLFFPFTKRRFRGLRWMRSGDALPNFGTVWFGCLLVFWNCYRAMPEPLYHFGFLRLMLYGGAIPLGLFGLLHVLLARRSRTREPIDTANEWGEEPA